MVNKLFFEGKYLKEYLTIVSEVFTKDDKFYVKLEDYIFYPQGGGQKGDRGKLIIDGNEYQIINTIKDFDDVNDIVINVDSEIDSKYIGKPVKCELDWDFRLKQMKLHSALHLYHYTIGLILNQPIDNPVVSSIDIGFAFNKYKDDTFDIQLIDKINEKYNELKVSDLKITTFPDKNDINYRYFKINDYTNPCGGLHVDKSSDIGDIDIKVTNKKGYITIKLVLI